ncbi:GNAT family N-acetyltransferase [Ornithinibacillus halotolerans]|uniref:Protein RibT n=1 Tax=Ornithinibacillus halotolerans TaxID=1274357 RepID=A0A916W2H2_9BACI|nr:GNAT family N-acetyltransferase [Ornithinibacillus halotolerans]GGA60934.1 protein RibT [Ornithinibacillus halotolerans]
MLNRYKKNSEKIAMGLLSFMPEEKDVKKLQATIKEYESNADWHLYLWKEDVDIVGAIGLRVDGDRAIIQHISVNPSHRNVGIGKKMIKEVKNLYGKNYVILAEASIQSYFEHCNQLDKTAE